MSRFTVTLALVTALTVSVPPVGVADAFSVAAKDARNDFGIGVGVGFPTNTRAGYSSAENYAPITVDKIIEELTVTEKGGRLKMEFKVTNNGDTPFTVEHKSGREFDIVILDKNGVTIWRQSDGAAFTQALTAKTYPAREAVIYTAEIERKAYRKIRDDAVLVTAYLTDTPYTVSTYVPDVVKSSGASGGTIIIGGGKTW